MTPAEVRKLALPVIKQVAQMGVWDGVSVACENGEPVVVAILQRPPILQFLSKWGMLKLPTLPKKIKGIRCRVELRDPAKPE